MPREPCLGSRWAAGAREAAGPAVSAPHCSLCFQRRWSLAGERSTQVMAGLLWWECGPGMWQDPVLCPMVEAMAKVVGWREPASGGAQPESGALSGTPGSFPQPGGGLLTPIPCEWSAQGPHF